MPNFFPISQPVSLRLEIVKFALFQAPRVQSGVVTVSWEAGSRGERVRELYGKAGSGMHSHSREAGFTRLWWIQGTISATLTAVGVEETTTKGRSSGALALNISFLYPNSIRWLIRVHGSCQANGEFLSYPVIDEPEGLHLLSQSEVTHFLKVPW
jgi:hypothetical protein